MNNTCPVRAKMATSLMYTDLYRDLVFFCKGIIDKKGIIYEYFRSWV